MDVADMGHSGHMDIGHSEILKERIPVYTL